MKEIGIKKTNYNGYVISTKEVDSHCSLIYKNGIFITALAAENSLRNKASFDKAKNYIDNLK